MTRFFQLVLLADQSLVQAGWVEPGDVPAAQLQRAVELLAQAPAGRAKVPGLQPEVELQWGFNPGRGIATARTAGRVTLVTVLVDGADPDADAEVLAGWLTGLRAMPPLQKLHGGDPEAFEVVRRLPDRPLAASVLLPEGTFEECKELVDFQRAVAAALFSARWGSAS